MPVRRSVNELTSVARELTDGPPPGRTGRFSVESDAGEGMEGEEETAENVDFQVAWLAKYAIKMAFKGPQMSSRSERLAEESAATPPRVLPLRYRLFARWYARLWWSAIVAYWSGAALAGRSTILADFYTSSVAAWLSIALFPTTALLVLGFGWAWAQLASIRADLDHDLSIAGSDDGWLVRGIGTPDSSLDIYDPRSGTMYVGNILSSHNGTRL
jgi:hypothetical protein